MRIFSIEVTSNTPGLQIASFPTAINASQYIRGKAEDLRLRRLARYSASEQALAESFQHCGIQQLPEELHLEALKKSTSILNALASDARDAVDRLRTLLANRSAEPTLYRSIQRQRWVEERRHVAFDQLSKTLRTELTRLSSSTNIGQTLTLESSNSKSNTNLIKFFESSRHRIPIRSRTRRRMPLPQKLRDEQPDDSHMSMELPRIHHENYIIPLVLKSPQRRRFFPSYTPQSSQDHSASSSSVENVNPAPSTASDASNLETIADDNETILHITLPVTHYQDDTDGTALIWRDVPRSKEEILAELHVSMPDYVADLLADFESTSRPGPITLSPHTRSRLDTFPPPTPRKPIQKSPSLHRLSTLFSGIPETITSRLTNIIGSDSTKASRVRLAVQPGIESIVEGPSRPAFSDFNPGNSGSQASDSEEEKMIVRIKRRMSTLGRT